MSGFRWHSARFFPATAGPPPSRHRAAVLNPGGSRRSPMIAAAAPSQALAATRDVVDPVGDHNVPPWTAGIVFRARESCLLPHAVEYVPARPSVKHVRAGASSAPVTTSAAKWSIVTGNRHRARAARL